MIEDEANETFLKDKKKYSIVKKLGSGIEGSVYLTNMMNAKNEMLKQVVMKKIILKKDAHHSHTNQILLECLNVSKLKHPSILNYNDGFIDINEIGVGYYCIIMPYYEE